MDYKKIDKDQLMGKLTDYLSSEYVDYVSKKEKLIEQKYQLEEEKVQMKYSSTESNMIQMKKLFSPLSVSVKENMEESKELKILDKRMREIQSQISAIEKKSMELKSYIQGLRESYFITSEVHEAEEVTYLFPAFYELLEHLKGCQQDINIIYHSVGAESKVLLTFSFLKEFRTMIRFFVDELLISTLNIEFFIEKNRVMIQYITKLDVTDSYEEFQAKKKLLEHKISKYFAITRWQEESIILQSIIE